MSKTKNTGMTDNDKANSLDRSGQSNSSDKVVSFSENQKKNTSSKRQEHSDSNRSTSIPVSKLPYDGVNNYKSLLEFQAQVMDELYRLTEDMLNELHYPADKFSLNVACAMEFLDVNIYEFIAGIGESLDLVFDAEIDGERYKTLASAFYRVDHIQMDSIVCKYDEKNDRWLVYTGEGDEWDTAPEEVVYCLRDD